MSNPVEIGQNLAKSALSNLMRGISAKLPKHVIRGNGMMLHLEPMNYTKMVRAKMSGKGVSITLSPMEREMNGEGLKEVFEKIKEGAKWVKDKIVDTPFYQSTIKPIVRKTLEQGISMIPNATAQDVARKGLEATSQKWGAWGMMDKPIYGGEIPIQTLDPYYRTINPGNMVSSNPQTSSNVVSGSGAMSGRALMKERMKRRGRRGGSFSMGGSFLLR